ncbi:MAG: hypothetical protein IPI90_02885 [Saprospiraceae bacterium]|nr:hypothetical protein [Candidatus Vicinibacter affinis]
MKKIILNNYFTYFNIALLVVIATFFTIDFFKAICNPTEYNFNEFSVDENRRSLKDYLFGSARLNIINYLLIILGYYTLKNTRIRIIFNILMICIYVVFAYAYFNWARDGYDH